MFCHGAKVGFYQGDISLLMDDIKTLKPTFFPVVPRLLNRIYDKVSKCSPALTCTSMNNCILLHFIGHLNTLSTLCFPLALLRGSRHDYNHCMTN